VDDAGGRDQLIRRIAQKVQFRGLSANGEVDRPDEDSGEDAAEFGGLQIESDTAQLYKFRQFPQDDRRYTPRAIVVQRMSGSRLTLAEKTSPVTFILPFMLPIRSAQRDSIGISRAIGFPCFVMTMPSGLR
jgi:hypothetical protein